MKSATFLASFPPIQSAIKITGDGNGMRVQLDIPETQMGEGVKLLAWRQKVLRVTVEPVTAERDSDPIAALLREADDAH